MSAKPQPAGFGRQTPPAVFPSIMGLFGLAIAWGRAEAFWGAPAIVSQLLLGMVVAVFAVALLAYLLKGARRPGAVMEDLRVLPGRAGVAAMSLCVALTSVALVPLAPDLARSLVWVALATHVAVAALIIAALLRGPAEQRAVTPVWHLSFVGFIVIALAAAIHDETELARILWIVTMVVAAGIWGVSLGQILRKAPPPPLRPLLAIHLAPAALFGLVALALGELWAAGLFAIGALALLAVLVLSGRWLTAAGFSPLWGAFTFPLAATSGLMLGLGLANGSNAYGWTGTALLAIGTVMIPAIAYRVGKLWLSGKLAVATNAARA